jgi:hypothetical protein
MADVPGGTAIDAAGGIHGIHMPLGSSGATITLEDGTSVEALGGYIIFDDPDSPQGYALALGNLFDDVLGGDWFFGDVGYVVTCGLFNGTAPRIFSLNAPMTRGMLVTVIGQLYGADAGGSAESGFGDIDVGAYFATYVAWA